MEFTKLKVENKKNIQEIINLESKLDNKSMELNDVQLNVKQFKSENENKEQN